MTRPAGVERHEIASREQWLALRQPDITASTIGAMLGIHEYLTPYELFALKTGLIEEDPEETPAMRRGRLLEPVAIELIREEHPDWIVAAPRAYYRDPAARLGATPDVIAEHPDRGMGVLQIKTVERSVFARKWRGDAGVEPPLWIACQAAVEAHLVGAEWAAVAAMTVGFGLDLHLVEVPLLPALIERIRAEVAAFWRRVAENDPPPPDYGRDGDAIARVYADEGTGPEIDLTTDNRTTALLDLWDVRRADEKAAATDVRAIKAELLDKLGTAAGARTARGRLSAPLVRRAGYAVGPAEYRQLKLKESA